MLLTVVIPVYNSSCTIARCLDSIFGLPLNESDFEVIAIDDCSTDNSVDILKQYADCHTNILILRQDTNHRQGAARNRGVSIAKGKYIVFVDSDDEVAPGMLSAVEMAENADADIVALRYAKVGKDMTDRAEVSLPYTHDDVFSGIDMQVEHQYWNTAPWSYVYRKTFLGSVNYPFAEDVLYEDSDFVNVHLYHARKMAYCDECGYVMHYNADSTTHTMSYKHLCDYALLGTRMLAFYESIQDKSSKIADIVLEGGSYNIMKAFRKLPRLKSCSEVRQFYDRLDASYDRKRLVGYKRPSYCWTLWTRLCLKHRAFVIAMTGIVIPFMKKPMIE